MVTKQDLEKILGLNRVEIDKDISLLLMMKVRTIAPFFFEAANEQDLVNVRHASIKHNLQLLILGGGSNLVILEKNPNLLVIRNRYVHKKTIKEDNAFVFLQVSSGYPVSSLVRFTTQKGYEGLEYHLGLPGTVGGAIYMNSKWTNPTSYFGDSLATARLVDLNGKIKKAERNYFNFAYDYSILQQTKEILLDAVFKLKKTDKMILVQRSEFALNYRKQTQPFGVATCGCFFRNIDGVSAGYLIDKAGLKGYSCGGFTISDKHANFIINKDDGTQEDLRQLLQIIKAKVREKFKVELKEEVVII